MESGPNSNIQFGADNNNYDGTAAMFAEKSIRNAFVSKVYAILSAQLAFTAILIGIFVSNQEIRYTFGRQPGWMFLGMGIFIITYLILACVESARRSFPLNFFLLAIMTFGYAFVAAVASCHYRIDTVLYAAIATAISTLLITLLAKSSKFDITSCGTTLCILGLAHCVIGSIMAITLTLMGYGNLASLLLAISGAFLVSLYLLFDTQLILGGRKAELSPEEYILAAILLYVDIIQLFIYLLEIINKATDD